MFQKQWHWFVLMAGMTIFGVLWIAYSRMPAVSAADVSRAAPRVGFNAPSFQLSTPSGDPIQAEFTRGKVLVLNFWATWCGPCRTEMPALQSVYGAHQRDGLVVIGVDEMEDAEHVTAFTRELKLQFPIGLDSNGTVAIRYQVRALPTTFFIDRHGVIRDIAVGGPMDGAFLESKIASLLSEP